MTPVEEQQMLASLAEISASLQGLLALTKDMLPTRFCAVRARAD